MYNGQGILSPAPCGQYGAQVGCNDNGAAGCWAYAGALGHDADDSCWLSGGVTLPAGTHYVIVDSASAVGGSYTAKVDRYATVNPNACVADGLQPEIQMGGTFYGTTNSATAAYYYGICTDSGGTGKYASSYHINHTQNPWRVTRGYVVSTDGTFTSGGYDTNVVLLLNQCSLPQTILGCNDDADHYSRVPAAGLGSRLVTGLIPIDRWASIDVTSWTSAPRGNFTMRVQLDDDGDGVPNASDGSTAMLGRQRNTDGSQGAIPVATWPYQDSRNSYNYPDNLLTGGALNGREVWYRRTPTATGQLYVMAQPWLRAETLYSGAGAALWDIGIYIYFPVAGTFCCYAGGWSCSATAAGVIRTCDYYGAGSREDAYVQSATAGQTYYVGIDAYVGASIGGWYTVTMWTP
jgi:hypothetical protein